MIEEKEEENTESKLPEFKIAILTASIGGIDNVLGIPKQNIAIDYFYYDDNNLPFPLNNLSDRLKARYLKSQTHRFLPDYDLYIWLDGRIKIEGNNFAKTFLDQVIDHDLAIYKHYERNNVYEELCYIDQQIGKGSQYLMARYKDQQLLKESLFYKNNGLPEDFPLFMGGFFARWNNDKVNKCFDEWWRRIIEFSYSDQTMLSFVAWEANLNINIIEFDKARTHKLFTIGKHAK